MGGLALREEDYMWITETLKRIAIHHTNGRIVSVLEGAMLCMPWVAAYWLAHIKVLSGL